MHLFGSIQHSWGNWMSTYPFCLSPMGEIMGWDGLWSEAVLIWGRADSRKAKVFLLPTPMSPNSYFFAPTECWNFSSRNLDAHQGSLIHGWMSQCSLGASDCSWKRLEPGHRPVCRVHSQDRGLFAYHLMHGWARLLLGPLVYSADCKAPKKAFLFMDRCWNTVVCGGGQKWGTSYATTMLTSLFP